MSDSLSILIDRSIGPLADTVVERPPSPGFLGSELGRLLSLRNGFLAIHGALLVRPSVSEDSILGLVDWNSSEVWKHCYPPLADAFCFAEDAFGNQFAIVGSEVQSFDAETAEFESFAGSLEEWAARILDEPEFHTGWTLLHEWQESRSALALGSRLAPRKPFVLGGSYSIDNLAAAVDVEGMKARGGLATQLAQSSPGSAIHYELRVSQ